MKILVLSTGTINCEPIIGSLEVYLEPSHRIEIRNYFENDNCFDEPADICVYLAVSGGPHLPSIDKLKHLKENCGKLIAICFDGGCSHWYELLAEYKKEQCFDRIVNIDGNDEWPASSNDLTLLAPIDHRPFKPVEKNIDFGFCGGWESEPRKEIISYLRDNANLTVRSRIESYFTYDEYAKFMSHCKVTVNMPQSGGGAYQVKARVIEAGLSSCVLLEQKNLITPKWFIPGFHYLEFSTKEEAMAQFKEIAANPELRESMASNLRAEIIRSHSPEKFWKNVLG